MLKSLVCAPIVITFFCFAALADESIDTNYRGPDAGTLIFSTSTLTISMNFTFYYKKRSDVRDVKSRYGAGEIDCRCVGFWRAKMSDPDYDTGYENGKVQIQHLPPGDYDVYTFTFGGSDILGSYSWYPSRGFSIPFTIKPGQATYIGNFARAPSLGTSFEANLGAAGYFVVSDKHDRDIAIARKKDPNLPPVTISVTDVAPFDLPFLQAQDPYAPPH